MNIQEKVKKIIKNPAWIVVFLNNRGIHLLNDEKYVKLLYKLIFNNELNLENPQKISEKMQWLKLYNRKPEYTKMVDKYEVKNYVKDIIGEEYIIPTLGVYDKFDDIDFEKLPNQFVIKCTHDSGSTVVCRDKNNLNIKATKKKINKCLKKNFYYSHREWPYKDVKPRIIIEKYLVDGEKERPNDYKIYCFNGKATTFLVMTDRTPNSVRVNFYDMNWKQLPISDAHTNSEQKIVKPINDKLMIEIAEKLSKDIPFVRVDFYEIEGHVYFGELTFFPDGGFVEYNPKEYDKIFGNMCKIK